MVKVLKGNYQKLISFWERESTIVLGRFCVRKLKHREALSTLRCTFMMNSQNVYHHGSHTAYLKISEGCNHRCAFIIPTFVVSCVQEVYLPWLPKQNNLFHRSERAESGIARFYSLWARFKMGRIWGVLRALTPIDGLEWIRLHYAYPIGLPESLLRLLPKGRCVHMSIFLQHASGNMLRRMRRGVTRVIRENPRTIHPSFLILRFAQHSLLVSQVRHKKTLMC